MVYLYSYTSDAICESGWSPSYCKSSLSAAESTGNPTHSNRVCSEDAEGHMKESASRKQNALVFSEYERVKQFTIWLKRGTMLSGSTVTTAWHVLGLRIEDTASRYGG
jgi:hypothetical protein